MTIPDTALLVNQIPLDVNIPSDEAQFKDMLLIWMKRVGNAVNTKEGGLYTLQEFFNFNQYYTLTNTGQFRNVYRKVFDLIDLNGGNIAGGATVAFPHGIVGIFQATLIYAGCTSVTPTYFSVMGQPTVYLDATNVNFTNPLPATALTAVMVVAEYLKN